LDGESYYISGDTDNIKEIQNVKCDVAFIPVRWNLYNDCR